MLYQSSIWKKLNQDIFKKPVFDIKINDTTYQAVIKQKSLFWFMLNRYQILWVRYEDVQVGTDLLRPIIIPQLPYKSGNILIQFWFVDIIRSDYTSNIKKYTTEQISIFEQKLLSIADWLLSKWWKHSIKQNLPEADIIIDTTKDKDLLRADISSNTKNHINKAGKKGVIFDTVKDEDDLTRFVQLYRWVWNNKWFGVVSEDLIHKLYDYLTQTKSGEIFVVRYGGRLVWWALCIFDDKNLIYLYGGNDTSIGNIWASQFMHWQIMNYAKDNWFNTYDMLGASRIWKEDRLSKVTQFKAWFWWTKYDYVWSFDIVLSPLLYKIYKLLS